VRISGTQVPPGYLRWATLGIGLLLLAIVAAVLANTLGLSGFTASTGGGGTRVTATVTAGAPCTTSGASERVTFTIDGREREARFDGCGHADGEQVEITVPAGDDSLVQAAQATVGAGVPGAGVGSLLLVTASLAGGGYAFLIRRGPRGRRLPKPFRAF
jgi:hypothetical protein